MTQAPKADERKAIYDVEVREAVVPRGTETTRLAHCLGSVRSGACAALCEARRTGQHLVDGCISAEQRAARVVQQTVPAGERLMPGLVYVGVAALAGPIFTRRRAFPIRYLSPLVFGAGAAAWFLPGSARVVLRNVWGRYGDPRAIDEMAEKWAEAKAWQQGVRRDLVGAVEHLRLSLQEGRGVSIASPPSEAPVAVTKAVDVPVVATKAPNAPVVATKAVDAPVVEKPVVIDIPVVTVKQPVAEDKPKNGQLPLGFKSND